MSARLVMLIVKILKTENLFSENPYHQKNGMIVDILECIECYRNAVNFKSCWNLHNLKEWIPASDFPQYPRSPRWESCPQSMKQDKRKPLNDKNGITHIMGLYRLIGRYVLVTRNPQFSWLYDDVIYLECLFDYHW